MQKDFTFDDFSKLVLNGEYSLYDTNALKRSLIKVDDEFVKKELTDKKQLLLFLNREYEVEYSDGKGPEYRRFQKNYYLLKSHDNEVPQLMAMRLSMAHLKFTSSSMFLEPYPTWVD